MQTCRSNEILLIFFASSISQLYFSFIPDDWIGFCYIQVACNSLSLVHVEIYFRNIEDIHTSKWMLLSSACVCLKENRKEKEKLHQNAVSQTHTQWMGLIDWPVGKSSRVFQFLLFSPLVCSPFFFSSQSSRTLCVYTHNDGKISWTCSLPVTYRCVKTGDRQGWRFLLIARLLKLSIAWRVWLWQTGE